MSLEEPAFVQIESISPAPTEAEAAAIALALDQAWPKPQSPVAVSTQWRFSGRPWSKLGNRFRS